MPTSPRLSPPPVLQQCTNVSHTRQLSLFNFFPTPPKDIRTKRLGVETPTGSNKRVKISQSTSPPDDIDEGDISTDEEYMEDEEGKDVFVQGSSKGAARSEIFKRVYYPYDHPPSYPTATARPSTRPILQSFVSSHKSDVFRCRSKQEGSLNLTPPYACSYSHDAKRGRTSHLAVATEEGQIHILNATRRADWDSEPQRTTFSPHNNAVFAVKWDESDARLATCSGDQSSRIIDLQTGIVTHVLRGHTNSIKTIAWDPAHRELLASGSKDGAICFWDLRICQAQLRDEHGPKVVQACQTIAGAHKQKVVDHKGKTVKIGAPGITGLLYPDGHPYGLITSGASDGILKYWDLRSTGKRGNGTRPNVLYSSLADPTTFQGSRRPRGIYSLAAGHGPSAGLIFGLGADSTIHVYTLPTLSPDPSQRYFHDDLKARSFFVSLSMSPCGRWLASGGASQEARAFMFDISTGCSSQDPRRRAVQVRGQAGEVGAVDWAQDSLATCADDGTVRVWRPDSDVARQCLEDSEMNKWEWSWSY